MNAGFRRWAANHTDGLAGTFASAGVGLGALAANGQAAQVANATVTLDSLKAFEVHADLSAQVALDDILAVLNGMNDLGELLLGQIFRADFRGDIGLGQN